MAKIENDLDVYYAVGNANTQRQKNELIAIIKSVILQVGIWSQQVPHYKILKTSFQIFIYFGKRISS